MWLPPQKKISGFTLIELSIVLVIVGLLVGGVITGRDLIQAAEVRKTGTLAEQIETATNVFRNKFNCLPGDCANSVDFLSQGASCGTGSLSVTGTCNGNGDGNIYAQDAFSNWNAGPENSYFFQQLILSKLLNDTRYCTLNNITCSTHEGYRLRNWGLTIPLPSNNSLNPAAIGVVYIKNATWSVGTTAPNASHALYFSQWTVNSTALTATAQFMLDSKFDDGMPLSGRLQTVGFQSTGIYNGHGNNSGSFTQGSAACNTSVYYATASAGFNCVAMWFMGF